jgi:23S rRNA (guanosine2251-2'-O)-methyltransferase
MSGEGRGKGRSAGKQAGGNRAKSGKPRPGTGGYGRRKLEGKGPTPAAEARPGHPAQRRASRAAAAAARGKAGARGSDPRGSDPRGSDPRGSDPRGSDAREPEPRGTGARGVARGSDSRGSDPRRTDPRRTDTRGARAPQAGRGSGGAGRFPSQTRGAGSAAEIVAGRNAVLESLRARVPASALHVGPRLDADDRINEAVKLAADTGIPVVEAGRSELDRLTGGAIHQGLALRIRPYAYAHPDDLLPGGRAGAGHAEPLIVALDGITDPRNLGAVVRSVAAFGGDGVLIPVRRSAGVTAGAWKASAGALARVPVAQAPNLSRTLAGYAEAGLFLVGLDADADDDIGALTLADGPLVLVIGSEGKGLSRLVSQQCDAVVKIPISGAESLNAGVAAGIALYAVSSLRADGTGQRG